MFKDQFFEGLGFVKGEPKIYTKKIVSCRFNINRTMYELERSLAIEVVGVDTELGTNIEIRVDNKLCGSGYWHTQEEFIKDLGQ